MMKLLCLFIATQAVPIFAGDIYDLHGQGGEIRMPSNFPWWSGTAPRGKYGNNEAVRWVITVDTDKVVELTFDGNFHVEKVSYAPVCYDRVQILDVDSVADFQKTLCGDKPPPVYTSRSNILVLEFCSDHSTGLAGFALDWRELEVSTTTSTSTTYSRDLWKSCGVAADQYENDVSAELTTRLARLSFLVPMQRIVGGREAPPHSWPWLAAIFYRSLHYCGGAIVNNQWIISAAHCFDDLFDWQRQHLSVKLGAHDRGDGPQLTSTEAAQQQVCKVKSIHLHPSYAEKGMENDIALVQLDCTLQYTDTVRPICLAHTSATGESLREPLKKLVVAGWGAVKFGEKTGSKVLKEAVLNSKKFDTCMSAYGGTKEYLHADTMFCASKSGQDTCQGDSGGPAMVQIDGKWTVAGITSWGYGCADPAFPGIYTDVGAMDSWIHGVLDAI